MDTAPLLLPHIRVLWRSSYDAAQCSAYLIRVFRLRGAALARGHLVLLLNAADDVVNAQQQRGALNGGLDGLRFNLIGLPHTQLLHVYYCPCMHPHMFTLTSMTGLVLRTAILSCKLTHTTPAMLHVLMGAHKPAVIYA